MLLGYRVGVGGEEGSWVPPSWECLRFWWQLPFRVILRYHEWKHKGPEGASPCSGLWPLDWPSRPQSRCSFSGRGHLEVEGGAKPTGHKGAFQETWPFLSGASPEMLRLLKVTAEG